MPIAFGVFAGGVFAWVFLRIAWVFLRISSSTQQNCATTNLIVFEKRPPFEGPFVSNDICSEQDNLGFPLYVSRIFIQIFPLFFFKASFCVSHQTHSQQSRDQEC